MRQPRVLEQLGEQSGVAHYVVRGAVAGSA